MKQIKINSLLILILFISSCSYTNKDINKPVSMEEVEIYFLNQKMNFNFKDTNQDYRVYVFIKNNSNEDIKRPHKFNQGIFPGIEELLVEYQKWNSKSKIYEDHPNCNCDYNYCYIEGQKPLTIRKGKVHEMFINLNFCYMINSAGKYRFRCHLQLPDKFNNKDFVSVWQEFNVN